jgi:hypothetical protein
MVKLLFEIKLALVRVEKDLESVPTGTWFFGDLRTITRKHPSVSENPEINKGS